MGFGGSVTAMINSIKNNKRDLKSVYKTNYNLRYKKSFIKLKDNGSSQKELEALRKRFRARNKRHKRVETLLLIALVLLSMVVFYFLFTSPSSSTS